MSDKDITKFQDILRFNSSTRVPVALEVDIVDSYNVFGNPGENDFTIIRDNLPQGAQLSGDVSAFDDNNQLSAIYYASR